MEPQAKKASLIFTALIVLIIVSFWISRNPNFLAANIFGEQNRCELVNGDWGKWKETSPCSDRGSTRLFTRTCNNPAPNCGGSGCKGANLKKEVCN